MTAGLRTCACGASVSEDADPAETVDVGRGGVDKGDERGALGRCRSDAETGDLAVSQCLFCCCCCCSCQLLGATLADLWRWIWRARLARSKAPTSVSKLLTGLRDMPAVCVVVVSSQMVELQLRVYLQTESRPPSKVICVSVFGARVLRSVPVSGPPWLAPHPYTQHTKNTAQRERERVSETTRRRKSRAEQSRAASRIWSTRTTGQSSQRRQPGSLTIRRQP